MQVDYRDVWNKGVEKFRVELNRKRRNVDYRNSFIIAASSQGVNYREISDMLGISPNMVRSARWRNDRNELHVYSDEYVRGRKFFRRLILGEEDSELTEAMADSLNELEGIKKEMEKANRILAYSNKSIDVNKVSDLQLKLKKVIDKQDEY